MSDAQGISLLCAMCGSAVGDDGRYWPGSGGLGCRLCKRRTPAQGIDSPKDGDGLPAPREAQEPGREAMRHAYEVIAAHIGVVNQYYVVRLSDKKVVGVSPSKKDAFVTCHLMNEMAGKS